MCAYRELVGPSPRSSAAPKPPPTPILCQAQVIQSINDRFLKAMKTKAGKENFRKSCAQIVNGLQKERDRKNLLVEEAKNTLQKANEVYTEYTEKQRRYLKAVRSFQEACNLNEKLSNKLERREGR